MYALVMNSGDGESLNTTFYGLFETHDEAHAAMVELIDTHLSDWAEEYKAESDCFERKVGQDEGSLLDGDSWDWRYYEKYFIFDADECTTVHY